MDWLKYLSLATGRPAAGLVRLIEHGRSVDPALADEWLATLRQAVSEENVTTLIGALKAELDDIRQLKLNPRDHPSDS